MNAYETREVNEAIQAADVALGHLQAAKKHLKSASNWGIVDLIGGGTLTGLIKHSKMGNAEYEIEAAKRALQTFSKELRDVQGYSSVHIDGFLTFADFFFDGLIADWLVQSKIDKARRQCDDAIRQVSDIRQQLVRSLDADW